MSKSWKATKRDIREYCATHEFDEDYNPNSDLSRHPNKRRHGKHRWYVMYGSPKPMHRNGISKDKQVQRQLDRNKRKNETNNIIETSLHYEEAY